MNSELKPRGTKSGHVLGGKDTVALTEDLNATKVFGFSALFKDKRQTRDLSEVCTTDPVTSGCGGCKTMGVFVCMCVYVYGGSLNVLDTTDIILKSRLCSQSIFKKIQ